MVTAMRIIIFIRLLADKRMADMQEGFLTAQLGWFNSLCHDAAGKWLEVIPAYHKLVMRSKDVRTALRYRMFMQVEGMMDG